LGVLHLAGLINTAGAVPSPASDTNSYTSRNNGALFALVLFIAMFSVYVVKNGVGLKVGLVTAVANKGVLLALVAMAQTLPILTSGLDLSVGMIFVLTNCIASVLLSGPPGN
jgi:ribose transport system permease protein